MSSLSRPSPEQHQQRNAERKAANLRGLMAGARGLTQGTYKGSTSGIVIAKEEKARPGKRTPTVAEREWMDAIVRYGCIACRLDGYGFRPPAVHHILRGGRRIGHLFTLPLCDPGHHQGRGADFPSRHPYKARFEKKYGTEMELLERLRAELGAKP